MPWYEIKFELSVPGTATKSLTRTIEATSVEDAIRAAKDDMVKLNIVAINPGVAPPPP